MFLWYLLAAVAAGSLMLLTWANAFQPTAVPARTVPLKHVSLSFCSAGRRARPTRCLSGFGSSAVKQQGRLFARVRADEGTDEGGEAPQSSSDAAVVVVEAGNGGHPVKRFLRRVARFFGAGKGMPNIKQLGLYAILSYGFVSNASYAICTGIAWYLASKKTGLSPLAPDQWQYFLMSYAALFAINNILRVPRFALSMSLAPSFDRLIQFFMRKSGRGKTFATGICVFLVNIMGTFALMASGILLASLFSGVPFWPAASS